MTATAKPRLSYIDWTRGLACLLMFQTHCYDAWLSPAARQSRFFMYSQLGGTFPAPLFLFLAGVSFAMVTEKLRRKNLSPNEIARKTILRGAEIFGYGLLFRLLAYIIAWGWAPATDLLRVDILNTIGLSMMLMGVVCWIVLALSKILSRPTTSDPGTPSLARSVRENWGSGTLSLILAALATALLISLLSPPLWTTWRPAWLPWPIESYIDGVHNLGVPQPGLFPIFPWTGFAFAGLALGFVLQTPGASAEEAPGEAAGAKDARALFAVGVAGIALILFARWLDAQPSQLYAVDDYWHTSPSFFLVRVGMLLLILFAAFVWCRWGPAKNITAEHGFSPFIILGQASLLVYWVHLEFVYGRLHILPKRKMGIGAASAGLLIISLAMIALAYFRTKTKGRGLNVFAQLRPAPTPAGRIVAS